MVKYYKLDEDKNVSESSLEEWATFIEKTFPINYVHVGDDTVYGRRVSTVFIGVDHNFNPYSKIPLIFETMVFDGDTPIYQDRYSTWKEAEEGHKDAIEWVMRVSDE